VIRLLVALVLAVLFWCLAMIGYSLLVVLTPDPWSTRFDTYGEAFTVGAMPFALASGYLVARRIAQRRQRKAGRSRDSAPASRPAPRWFNMLLPDAMGCLLTLVRMAAIICVMVAVGSSLKSLWVGISCVALGIALYGWSLFSRQGRAAEATRQRWLSHPGSAGESRRQSVYPRQWTPALFTGCSTFLVGLVVMGASFRYGMWLSVLGAGLYVAAFFGPAFVHAVSTSFCPVCGSFTGKDLALGFLVAGALETVCSRCGGPGCTRCTHWHTADGRPTWAMPSTHNYNPLTGVETHTYYNVDYYHNQCCPRCRFSS
jgi:hypothetical protein